MEIVISPGFGAGLSTWNTEIPDMERNPALVKYIKRTPPDLRTEADVRRVLGLGPDDLAYISSGALESAVVVKVSGPYLVQEYDGSESVIEASDLKPIA